MNNTETPTHIATQTAGITPPLSGTASLASLTPAEQLDACLEIIAARTEDLAPPIYQRFFSVFPEAHELFGGPNFEDGTKSRMIIGLVLQLLELADDKVYHYNIERWIYDHMSYGVTLPMYAVMFDALMTSLAEVMDKDWSPALQHTWQAQADKIMVYVARLYDEEANKSTAVVPKQ